MPINLSPEERTLRARGAAFAMHAQHDPRETTKPAREKFLAGFLERVDPEHRLSDAERERRAEAALRSHMTFLALKSARSRRKRAVA